MAKARANITRKGGRLPKSAGCGLRSNARSRRSAAMRRRPAPCTSRRRNHAALQGPEKNARAPLVFLLLFAWSDASASLRGAQATKQSIPPFRRHGLLRGVYHRASLCADPLARSGVEGARNYATISI